MNKRELIEELIGRAVRHEIEPEVFAQAFVAFAEAEE